MKIPIIIRILVAASLVLAVVPAVSAQDSQNPYVIYQTTFSTDPHWETNNPSTNYWDSSRGMYRFSIEPSTGMYAFVPVEYERGPFKLEYDVILERVDEGATFRLGFSGTEMDPSKGPNVLSQFTNAKYGQIMWLHIVTNGNKMMEVNSQKGDRLASGSKGYYDGPTVKYELNKTYHVVVNYDTTSEIVTMSVSEKLSGTEIWSYFINIDEDLHGMNRIYIGSKGDYGMMGIYARGYLDNVRLTVPAGTTPTPTPEPTFVEPLTTRPTPIPTTIQTIGTVPTSPPETPESPSSPLIPAIALGLAACIGIMGLNSRK